MDVSPQEAPAHRRDPHAARSLQRVSSAAAAVAAGVALAAFLSWPLGLPWLRSAGHAIEVQPNAALGMVLAGAALLLRADRARPLRRLAGVCAAVASAMGGLTLAEHALHVDLGVDQLFVSVGTEGPGTLAPGRMGPLVALELLVLGFAILLLDARGRSAREAAQLAALVIVPVPLLAIVGHAYGVTLLDSAKGVTAVALPAAIALLLVDISVLLARPDHGFVATLASNGAGSTLVRRMLAYALALPLLLGGLSLAVSELGPSGALVVSVLVVGVTLVFVLLVLRDATALDRMERAKDDAQRERGASRAELSRALRREQEARAHAEAASCAKDEFLAALSHELRTPLNAILGWSRLLRDAANDPPRLARGVAVVERNGRALAQLLSDLLDMPRFARCSIALQQADVELAHVVDAAIEAVQPAADAKGIALSHEAAPDLPHVVGDAARLQQIAWNLLSNAVKFTGGGGHVGVALAAEAGQVVLSVEDNGVGMAPDFLAHVFESRQADGSSARRFGGLGLGLALTQKLVALHGGSIQATSAGLGRGATFRVALPAAAPTGPTLPAPRPRAKLAGARILVVDDDADSRDLLLQLLASWGARPAGAGSAGAALEAIARERPDLLVSDIAMPGEDGLSLVARLRRGERERGEEAPLPAAALTAFARPEDRYRALDAGFDAHVAKPVEPDVLLATLAALLEQRPRPRPPQPPARPADEAIAAAEHARL